MMTRVCGGLGGGIDGRTPPSRVPSGGLRGWGNDTQKLQINFMHHHVREMIVIIEEGNHPQPC